MDELYIPKMGFEDLFQVLLDNYKREAQAIIDEVDNKERRNEDWPSAALNDHHVANIGRMFYMPIIGETH